MLAAEPLRYPGAAAHDERAVGLPGTDHGVPGARLPGSTSRSPARQSLALDQPAAGVSISASPSARPDSLPRQPLDYITRQAQGDFVVMDQREGDLWTEAGMVTTQADWSLDFDVGMTFKEWHGPVPLAHELGVFDRALKYLLNLRLGQPVRRLNWTMTVHPRLDTSPENYPKWGPDRATVTPQNAGRPGASAGGAAGAVAAAAQQRDRVRHPLLPHQRARAGDDPQWARRVHRVLKNLHPALVDYKGLTRYRDAVVEWLAPYDDGAPTTPGAGPE